MELGAMLKSAREVAGIGLREVARQTNYTPSYLSMVEKGTRPALPEIVAAYERVLGPDAILTDGRTDGELEALAWAQRVSSSDVGGGVLEGLERRVDDLASAYTNTAPGELLVEVAQHLRLAGRMLDGKTTLAQHRRLVVAVGWLSVLASTCHIDLGELRAADARLGVAKGIAAEAEHREIAAWILETRAWQKLISGDFVAAVELSRAAQDAAPRDSSAYIQATAQEGRALARLGDPAGTHFALRRVASLVSGMGSPDRPEHHFQYDPAKSDAYVATTLAWLGDPAAESHARHVLADLTSATPTRPRRILTASIDLGLALVAAGKPDEAAHVALGAVTSGRLVPSNIWRLSEVVDRIGQRDQADAATVRVAIRDTYFADSRLRPSR
ncbi:helix-turn-helix domain-containing protein [Nocardia sp. 2]|uniref:Helix-turn-helix domain-containing protein n=2 Tax=Nocardia acididurans TaxID=2802282 RepID=A0ABS1M592_9NOCA|nr:helix-turn-helix domain-containing protein [Nocardia acididurans]